MNEVLTLPRQAVPSLRLALLGPAFIAAIAYVDPGNFATNISAGSKYGFLLLWVILAANIIAMLVQYLSAKLGIATGRTLPSLIAERFPRARYFMWMQAEAVAMATDVAEFIGGSLALNLLFGIGLLPSATIIAICSFLLLGLHGRGHHPFTIAIGTFLLIIVGGFLYGIFSVDIPFSQVAGGIIPGLSGTDSVLLACGILGATVMPHVIYTHSALTSEREDQGSTQERLKHTRFDIGVAMTLAGIINISMLVLAATIFYQSGPIVDTIEGAYAGFKDQLGVGMAWAFGIALLASGIASSTVGTFSGQIIMQGFIKKTIPLLLRRAITMVPALIIIIVGVAPTTALILSQVVLSFGIPFALIPLVMLTRDKKIMGEEMKNRIVTTALASFSAIFIVLLNGFLLSQLLF